jgi:hypothetical protein
MGGFGGRVPAAGHAECTRRRRPAQILRIQIGYRRLLKSAPIKERCVIESLGRWLDLRPGLPVGPMFVSVAQADRNVAGGRRFCDRPTEPA